MTAKTPTNEQLPRWLVQDIMHHAQCSADKEVCGLLGGKDGVVVSHYKIANVAETPANRFALDPTQQIAATKKMRDRDEHLFAIYHSHPTAAATPSDRDYDEIGYDNALYLIISLNTKGVLEIGGWKIAGDGFTEVELDMVETARPAAQSAA